jgi:hypothetical protein
MTKIKLCLYILSVQGGFSTWNISRFRMCHFTAGSYSKWFPPNCFFFFFFSSSSSSPSSPSSSSSPPPPPFSSSAISYVGPRPTLWFSCSRRFSWSLTLSNPIFLPPAYSPALFYFGRERGWWITCNYPTVLKEKNRNRKSTTFAIC